MNRDTTRARRRQRHEEKFSLTTEDDPELAFRWTATEVEACLNKGRKKKLVEFLQARYDWRFFKPITCLHDEERHNHKGYGMSIMALCALLVESIQCCRHGLPSTYRPELYQLAVRYNPPPEYVVPQTDWRSGEDVFIEFFEDFRDLFPNVSGREFYRGIRNGLLHQAQTKNGWRIRVDGEMLCDPTEKTIDRDRFTDSLETAFGRYVDDLRRSPLQADVWQKAMRRIWWLITMSRNRPLAQ